MKWLARVGALRLGEVQEMCPDSQVLGEFRMNTFLGSMAQVFEFSGNPGVGSTLEEKPL